MQLSIVRLSVSSPRLPILVGGLLLGLSLSVSLGRPTLAQTTPQTYNCGTYGAGDFSGQTCAATVSASPAPTPIPATPTPTAPGSTNPLPGTGASLGWLAAIGALLVALGLAGYGLARRRRHVARSTPPAPF